MLGGGALIGDAVESFFKRQIGVSHGNPWIPFDQIDYTIGAILFGSIFYFPGFWNSVILIVVSAVLHILVNHIGFCLKIRSTKW